MNTKGWSISFKKLFLLGVILRLILILASGWHPDVLNHVDWGARFWQYGARRFYEAKVWSVSWPNQPPGSILLFALIYKLYKAIFAACWWLNLKVALFPSFIFPFLEQKLHIVLLKLPFVLTDLGLAWLVYKISRSQKAAFLILFNPALIYISAIWGQTDPLVNFLALWGLWLVSRGVVVLGILLFVASLWFKLSLLIWAPIIAILIWQNKKWRQGVIGAGLGVITFYFLSCSFLTGVPFWRKPIVLWRDYVLLRQGHMLSANAFNLWTLLFGVDLSLKDNLPIFGIPAYLWGATIFAVVLGFLLWRFWHDWLLLSFFIPYAAFLFLPGMHERYLYPIFAPLSILVVKGGIPQKWFWLLTGIYFANLYHLWWYPPISIFKTFFDTLPLAKIFSTALLIIFLYLIGQSPQKS